MDTIIIGSIMLLVPGIAITNAIRDTIAGDLVSGVSRSMEALFIAIAIAAGTSVVFKIWFLIFGGALNMILNSFLCFFKFYWFWNNI